MGDPTFVLALLLSLGWIVSVCVRCPGSRERQSSQGCSKRHIQPPPNQKGEYVKRDDLRKDRRGHVPPCSPHSDAFISNSRREQEVFPSFPMGATRGLTYSLMARFRIHEQERFNSNSRIFSDQQGVAARTSKEF